MISHCYVARTKHHLNIPEPFIGVSGTHKSLPTFFKSLRRLLQELDHVQQSCRSVNLVNFPLGINVKSAAILPDIHFGWGGFIIFICPPQNEHIKNISAMALNMMFLFPVGGCWWDMSDRSQGRGKSVGLLPEVCRSIKPSSLGTISPPP